LNNLTIRNGHMTAAVLYGRENLKVEQVEIPAVGPREALVRVKVALLCGTDLKVWRQGHHPRMITPPAVFGHELAGVVESVGSEVTNVRPGMRVVPANSAPCNECIYCRRDRENLCENLLFNNGAYAEYIHVPARILQKNTLEIPAQVDYTDAALVEPLACVLRGLEETGVREGDTVVVLGCGPIGLMFIRLGHLRRAKVIALGKRHSQMEAAKRLGAAAAIDVNRVADPVRFIRQLTEGGRGADAVIEAVGLPATWQWALEMVRKGGTVNLFGGCPTGSSVHFDPALLHYSEITIKSTFHHTPRFIREAMGVIASGGVQAADFVTGEIPLAELPAMFRHLKHRNGELRTAVIP
jgi:L-iditol 2-dehydrogenase